jgi:hypothetical protein
MKESSKKRFQWKRLLLWGAGAVIVILTMLYFDKEKVYKEEKPPMPVITVGDTEVQAIMGSYRWNDGLVEKEMKEISKSLKYQQVPVNEEMRIEFPEGEEPIYFNRGSRDYNGNFSGTTDSEINYLMPNHTGLSTISIKAYWKDGKRADYLIPLKTSEVKFKEYYARYVGTYSILIVNEDTQSAEHAQLDLQTEFSDIPIFYNTTDKQYFPELNIDQSQAFLLFDHQNEIVRTDDVVNMKKYIRENIIFKEVIEGTVSEIDHDLGFVTVNGRQLIIEPDLLVKTGQKVSVKARDLISKFHSPVIEELQVLRDRDQILNDPKWLSKEPGKLSILAIGDSEFLQPLKTPHKEDLKLAGSITTQESLKLNNGEKLTGPAIYIFNHKELIFQTSTYDELLKYLFSREALTFAIEQAKEYRSEK